MGRLCSISGELVRSEARCDTFGEYSEIVQWAVRPASQTDDPGTGDVAPTLPMKHESINQSELRDDVGAFKTGNASGPESSVGQ